MSTQYNGNGSIPEATNPTPVTIASSTNASPIVVTTSTAHGYNNGDTVVVEGHQTNTNANGTWPIVVTGPNAFQLQGSTGNGVGGATGYVIDYSVNPLIQLPADLVDPLNAASINPAIEGIFNAVPYLYMRTGKYRLYDSVIIASGGETIPSIGVQWGSTTLMTNSTWTEITGTNVTYPHALQAGDILEIELSALEISGTSAVFGVGIGASINGGSMQILGSFDSTGLPSWVSSNNHQTICAKYIGGVKSTAMPITAGGLVLAAMGTVVTGTANIALGQPYWIKINHFRSNA
jgi:hypothetical protein